MDAYLIKACFPLVTRNATERLQDLIDSKIEEITDKITDGVFNKTTEFMFAEDSGADNFETTYFCHFKDTNIKTTQKYRPLDADYGFLD